MESWLKFDAAPDGSRLNLEPAQLESLEHTRHHDSVFQFFGDTVIVSIPLQADNRRATWRAIELALSMAAYTQLALLQQRQVMRGGIDLGWGFVPYEPPYENEVVGACVARAHDAELEAIYPRVKLGAHLEQFLRESALLTEKAALHDAALDAKMGKRVLDQFRVDPDDGVLFLDSLGHNYCGRLDANAKALVIESARATALKGIDAARSRDDKKVLAKYEWLERYVDASCGS